MSGMCHCKAAKTAHRSFELPVHAYDRVQADTYFGKGQRAATTGTSKPAIVGFNGARRRACEQRIACFPFPAQQVSIPHWRTDPARTDRGRLECSDLGPLVRKDAGASSLEANNTNMWCRSGWLFSTFMPQRRPSLQRRKRGKPEEVWTRAQCCVVECVDLTEKSPDARGKSQDNFSSYLREGERAGTLTSHIEACQRNGRGGPSLQSMAGADFPGRCRLDARTRSWKSRYSIVAVSSDPRAEGEEFSEDLNSAGQLCLPQWFVNDAYPYQWAVCLGALIYPPPIALAACAGVTGTAASTGAPCCRAKPYWTKTAWLTSLTERAYSPGYKIYQCLGTAKSEVGNQNSNTATNSSQSASMNALLTFPSFTAAGDGIH
ncbi:hypothetical protein C8R46DRAFT_1184572 [Mycena filopes]|nr:hypothetical protein C8R46DRAFT_1184572 [Mycena filopes]